jgi:DNA-binding transcriptional LysR family regulator
MLSLGSETLAPYAKADGAGVPLFRLPSPRGMRVPFLSYAAGAYLGRLVEVITKLASAPLNLDPIYETDMAEGLKAMALEGHGLAFLPASSVKKELKSKRLLRASAPGEHELAMEVRIYRERPELARHAKPGAVALWEFLRTHAGGN